jgi:Flp pilus assembly secretin CpaC
MRRFLSFYPVYLSIYNEERQSTLKQGTTFPFSNPFVGAVLATNSRMMSLKIRSFREKAHVRTQRHPLPPPTLLFSLLAGLWAASTHATTSLPLQSLQAEERIGEKSAWVLGQGEQRLFRVRGLMRYSIGSDAVRAQILPSAKRSAARFKPSSSSLENQPTDTLLIKGIHPGQADLWVWNQDGSAEHRTIRVEKVLHGELKPGLERALSHLEEAEVLISGEGVLLRGQITTIRECARIRSLVEGFPKEIKDETQLSTALLEEGKNRLDDWLKTSPYRSLLRTEIQNGTLFLLGSIEKNLEQTSIRKQALALFPSTQLEISSLPDDAPTIYFRVFLLELKKSHFRQMGISWPGTQEGAFRVTTSGIQDLLQLDLALQELEGEGSIKILSNPELAVRAPGEAELFSGGELPIHAQGRFYSNISWRNFGLTLKLKVTHTAGDRIRLDIFTEVSHLDPSLSDDKVPGIQANRMKTQVDARFGIPLLLSGLLQQGTRQQARGLPLLRQIPVLGALFGSEDYLNEKSELVAILLPSASPPPAPMQRVQSQTRSSPLGPVPPPRNWIRPSEERALRGDREFPWNALKNTVAKDQASPPPPSP